jgi:hypothetical protein
LRKELIAPSYFVYDRLASVGVDERAEFFHDICTQSIKFLAGLHYPGSLSAAQVDANVTLQIGN